MPYTGSTELLSDFLTFADLVDGHDQNEDKGLALAADRKLIKLNVDYTKFSNHCWFNSAYTKTYNAFYRIQNIMEHDCTYNALQEFYYSGTHFDQHVYDYYPRGVGYLEFQAGVKGGKRDHVFPQYVTGSDPHCLTAPGTGSWTFECWAKPFASSSLAANTALFQKSGSTESVLIYYSRPTQTLGLGFISASTITAKAVAFPYNKWNYVAFAYDRANSWLTVYTASATQKPVVALSQSFVFKDIFCYDAVGPNSFFVASGNLSVLPLQVFSGCIDELRIWRTNLSASFINDYYNQSVWPDHNNLVLYYKFNEGTTDTASIDCQVKDYSGNDLDGYVKNYLISSSVCRVSGTALLREDGTVLHSQNSRVSVYQTEWLSSGSIYDEYNDQLITRQFPDHHIEDDTDSSFTKYLYALAESLDELQLYQDHFVNLGVVNYTGKDSCPDELLPQYTHREGFDITPLFEAGNTLQQFFGENILLSSSTSEHTIDELKKLVWRRIANNATYLLKTKGTPKSIKGLLNTVGLDERQIKIKRYSFLPGERIDDNRVYSYLSRRFLYLSASNYIHQLSDYSFNSETDRTNEICWMWDSGSTLLSSSLIGTYDEGAAVSFGTLRWYNTDNRLSGSLHVIFNKDVWTAIELSSSVLPYSADNRYHAAFGREAQADGTAKLFLYWAVYDVDRIIYSGCMSSSTTTWYTNDVSTRIGLDVDDGSIHTCGYFSEYRSYSKALNLNEFLSHVWDPRSVGTYDPILRSASVRIPMDDNNVSSTTVYMNDVARQGVVYTGTVSVTDPFRYRTIYYKPLSQDFVWNEDDIRIRNASELKKSEQAIDGGMVSLEMNPVDSINEDIGRLFSSNRIHNEILGDAINKLRPYADYRKYQQAYFKNYVTHMEFNKYFDAYKWVDANVSKMVEQLVDASRKYYGAQFVIEPHVLELQKGTYQYSVFKTPYNLGYADYTGAVEETGTLDRQSPSTGSDNAPDYEVELTFDKSDTRKCGNYGGGLWTASAGQCDPFVDTDNINYRSNMIVGAMHSSSVAFVSSSPGRSQYKQNNSGTFLTDYKQINLNGDFERMNLRYYYTLKMNGAGTFNNTVQSTVSNYTKFCAYHCNIKGFKAKQIYVDVEVSCSVAVAGNLLRGYFKAPWYEGGGSFEYFGKPYEKLDDYTYRARAIFAPSSSWLSDLEENRPEFDVSGTYAMCLRFVGATDYVIRRFDVIVDAHSTAAINNDQLARNFTSDLNAGPATIDGNFTYFHIMDDVYNKEAPLYLPEETNLIKLKTFDGESKTHTLSQSWVGGVHYANVGGIVYDGLYKGTKSYGKMGITDMDLIKVEQVGSKIVTLWPNQLDLDLSQKSKKFMLQNAYGALLPTAASWYHGQVYYLDDDYDTLTLWCYTLYCDGVDETPDDIIKLDVAIQESPFLDGPLTAKPMVSSSIYGQWNQLSRAVNNIYRISYPVTLGALINNEWYSYQFTVSVKGIKRLRISAMQNSVIAASDPAKTNYHLNNLIVFGQFSKENVITSRENMGDPRNIIFDADSNVT